MSFVKISDLTEKVTLAGTEEVLINDSGTSKKMATQRFLDVQTAAEAAQTAAEAAQTAAETAETNAETAETNAAASASAAATSASNAATSATNASNSATAASNAQSAAETARDQTLTAFDNFDDRYLGTKASDPTLDNDGNALVAGALYFNSTDGAMKVYDGSQWLAAYASLSGALLSANNLSDLNDAATSRTNLGLGTAATTASTDYATAAQGSTADSAVQPGDNVSDLTNDAGYLTSYTETDPVFTASEAASITSTDTSNWDAAYGWGNHASAGYLTSFTETDPVVGAVTGLVKADGAGNISAAVAGTDYVAAETYSSASDLLTAIKTVDGTGSGLDADTLDGNDSSAFYLATNPAGYTTNTGTVTSVNLTASTGISVSGGPVTTSGSITVTNTAPDQTVVLTGGTGITTSGTYPNFTIDADNNGTVTSVSGTGSYGGLTLSGTVTTSGSLTLGGTPTGTWPISVSGNAATVSNGVYLTSTQTLTNKTLTSPSISNPTITGAIDEQVYNLTGTTLDPSNGTIQYKTLAANTTLTDSLAEGESITLMIDDGSAYTITWPTMTWVNNGGTAPTLATSGYTTVALWKVSTTLYGALVGDGT